MTHTPTHTRARRILCALALALLALASLACCAAPETAPEPTPTTAADPVYSVDPVGPECLVIVPQQGADYVGASVMGTGYGTWFDATGRAIGYAAAEDAPVWSHPDCI